MLETVRVESTWRTQCHWYYTSFTVHSSHTSITTPMLSIHSMNHALREVMMQVVTSEGSLRTALCLPNGSRRCASRRTISHPVLTLVNQTHLFHYSLTIYIIVCWNVWAVLRVNTCLCPTDTTLYKDTENIYVTSQLLVKTILSKTDFASQKCHWSVSNWEEGRECRN